MTYSSAKSLKTRCLFQSLDVGDGIKYLNELDLINVLLKTIYTSRQLVQVLSGHSKLRSFLHRIGIESEGTCSCQANIETTQHFLFDCHLYHSLRAPILHSCRNIPWPPPLHFFTSSTHKLTLLKSFIHNTKRLWCVHLFCFCFPQYNECAFF